MQEDSESTLLFSCFSSKARLCVHWRNSNGSILDWKRSVLHIIDTSTHFCAAIFIEGQSTKDIWYCFIVTWATAYTGYPNCVRVDQQAAFTSYEFSKLCADAGIEV